MSELDKPCSNPTPPWFTGQLCDLHEQLTLRWVAARDALCDRARAIGSELS